MSEKQKTKEEIQQEIKELNERFINASPEEKRVIIARDVIKNIESSKYHADSGTYLNIYSDTGGLISIYHTDDTVVDKELQDIITEEDATCEVCAIGACLMSLARIHDNLKVDTKFIGSLIARGKYTQAAFHEYLAPYFDAKQLRAIEMAFEGSIEYIKPEETDYYDEAVDFYECSDGDDNDRLIAIMQNIIDNNGTFKP